MANVPPSRRKATSVGICFDLKRFHTDLAGVWNRSIERPGEPGGGAVDLTGELRDVASSYLFSELFSKFDDGKTNPVKEESTWKRFHEAEDLCRDTNSRMAQTGFKGPYEGTLELARTILNKLLGVFDWDLAAEGMGWGPGASTRLPRRMSDAAYKYSGIPESTAGNSALAIAAIRCVPTWERVVTSYSERPVHVRDYIKTVDGSRIVTVPKNYKTDRTIAIEPEMNMYVQKGIGALMRKRLRFAGCDLNDQTRNQRLARVGSMSGRLATIDLSMASDTVSRQFVQRMVREDWLQALEQSRSPFGVLPSGEKIFFQKFSSMGNGYTFELESALFYSLVLAHCHIHGEEVSRVSVYGDDIILPSTVAESFIGLLQFCGFRANEKKSFWTGQFRESCGKHYFNGHDITPFYVRRPVKRLTDLFLVHNNLFRLKNAWGWMSEEDAHRIDHILWWIRQYAPSRWRKPRLHVQTLGDGAFLGSFEECAPQRAKHGIEAWEVRVLAEVTSPDTHFDLPGLLCSGLQKASTRKRDLYGCVDEPSSVYPGKDRRIKEITILVPQYALGRPYNLNL